MRLLLLLFVVGCDPAFDQRSREETATDLPTLTFHADWSITQTGTLVAGRAARIRYDVTRLPNCRATYNGLPAWGISASWNADGGWGHGANVTGGGATFIVPAGRDLQVWFFASDEAGCTQYDSDYGRNFHFAIVAPAIVHFRHRDFAVAVDGTLRAGEDLMIDYELARSPFCRASSNGLAAWDVVAHWRFDGGAISDGSLSIASDSARDSVPLRVATPPGARDLEVWFENTDRTSCRAWDSDFGRNFHFALQ